MIIYSNSLAQCFEMETVISVLKVLKLKAVHIIVRSRTNVNLSKCFFKKELESCSTFSTPGAESLMAYHNMSQIIKRNMVLDVSLVIYIDCMQYYLM
jgi:hypothetical protein